MKTELPEPVRYDTPAELSGLVFDIQRCSLQDGPGIRTTVFLKGCPLRCVWCHNPESISPKPQLSYDEKKCVGCFHCLGVCTEGAHMRNSFGEHELDFDRCTACGQCIDVCVGEAVRIIGEPRTVGEVMEVVLRDRAYYGKSGGGLTLSGGEPMAQFEFSLSLLKAARSQGIHTCVETSGAASWRKYEQVLPWTDLFLFDYKATKPASHQELVGCSNAPLLQNLDRLIGAGAQVILRCPMVPGVNVTPDHLRGIAKLSAKYPQLVGIEIMPYHNLGVSKAERIGVESKLPPIEPPTKALQDEWLHRLHGLGCPAARIG